MYTDHILGIVSFPVDVAIPLPPSDLSFNNIEEIEGLDKLVNLCDLSLAHNRLSRIDHLESLTQLEVLSLGSNLLEDLENVSTFGSCHLEHNSSMCHF